MEGEEEMAPIVVDQSKVKNFTVKKLLYIILEANIVTNDPEQTDRRARPFPGFKFKDKVLYSRR